MSVAQVSLLLGHASIQTTMAYLDVTVDAELDAMRRLPFLGEEPRRRWRDDSGSLLELCGLRP